MDLETAERRQLAMILGCAPEQVEERVAKFSAAATQEYLRMILGQRVFTRGSDILEYRLLLMIVHVFGGTIPTERQVSDLFQTTATQSRSLLRAVMSKFQYELQEAIDGTITALLQDAVANSDESKYTVVVNSQAIVEAVNRRLGQHSGELQPLTRVRNTISQYEMPASSYGHLTGSG